MRPTEDEPSRTLTSDSVCTVNTPPRDLPSDAKRTTRNVPA